MYLLDDSKCAAGPIAPTPAVGLDHDRRRPGRIHEMNPALIPLLRNPVEVVIVMISFQRLLERLMLRSRRRHGFGFCW